MKFILFFAFTASQASSPQSQVFMDLAACERAKEMVIEQFVNMSSFASKEPRNTTKAFCVPDRSE